MEIKGFTTQPTDLFDEDSTTKPHFPTDTKKVEYVLSKKNDFSPPCVYVGMETGVCEGSCLPMQLDQSVRSPRAGVTERCEPPVTGNGCWGKKCRAVSPALRGKMFFF